MSSADGRSPDSAAVISGPTTRPWLGLTLLAFPLVVLALDVSVLFLAAPALTRDLDASPDQVLWITDIYGFFIAGFLIVMGVLGDRVGRRRLLLIGCLAFAGASVCAAFAPSAEWLIVARALLGLAGATLMPSTLALIRVLFPDEQKRQKAIAVWMTAFSASVAVGPVLGGFVIDQFWWGAVFLFPVPLLVAFAIAARFILPEQRELRDSRIDFPSAGLIVTAMLGTAYTVKNVAVGDVQLLTLVILALAVTSGVLAVRRQFRTEHPLVEPALLTDRRLLASLALLLMSVMALNGFFFLVPQYFQYVEGRSATTTGLLMLPLAITAVVSSLMSPVLLRLMRPSYVVTGCAVVSFSGFVALALQQGQVGALPLTVLGCVIVAGISSLGVVMTDLVVGVAPARHAGAAAGLSETSGELGVAFGVAIMGSVYVFAYRQFVLVASAAVEDDARAAVADSISGARGVAERAGAGQAEAILDLAGRGFMSGLSWAAAVGAIAMGLCILLATTVLRTATTPSDSEASETSMGGVPGGG